MKKYIAILALGLTMLVFDAQTADARGWRSRGRAAAQRMYRGGQRAARWVRNNPRASTAARWAGRGSRALGVWGRVAIGMVRPNIAHAPGHNWRRR